MRMPRPPPLRRNPRKLPVDEPPSTTTEEDRELFRGSIGDVREIVAGADAALRSRPRPPPDARMSEADERAVIDNLLTHSLEEFENEIGDPLRYVKEGLSPRLLRQLGRGEYSVRDEFDLHQMSLKVAQEAVSTFLDECVRDGRLCVRIVHGKGLRSGSRGPVLKALVDQMLRRRGDVLAYRSARAEGGGSGAVIVLLRAKSPRHS